MAKARLRAFGAALLLAACSGGARDRLKLGTGHSPAFGLVYIAEANGFFTARGLTVEQRRFGTGRDAIAALAVGEVDAATAFVTPIALRGSGDDVEILTTLHTTSRNTRLVARGDRGIRRAEDLAGRRIGVAGGTSAEYFLHTLLAFAGVEGEADLVDIAPAAGVDALVAGRLDAIATWSPDAERARRMLGAAGAIEIESDVYTEISVLAVRDATHQARRGALVKLVAGLADAERLVRERPDQAFQAFRAEFAELSEPELRDAWSRITLELGMTHELAAVIEREAAWHRGVVRAGGAPVDLGVLLDPDVLSAVDAEAVTFVSPARGKDAR